MQRHCQLRYLLLFFFSQTALTKKVNSQWKEDGKMASTEVNVQMSREEKSGTSHWQLHPLHQHVSIRSSVGPALLTDAAAWGRPSISCPYKCVFHTHLPSSGILFSPTLRLFSPSLIHGLALEAEKHSEVHPGFPRSIHSPPLKYLYLFSILLTLPPRRWENL